MTEASRSLCYPARPRVLLAYTGRLLLVLAAIASPVLPVAVLAGEWTALAANAAAVGFLALAGWGLRRVEAPVDMQRNEAIILVCLLYCISSVVMALPMLPMGISFEDALFESISGITTTGLSTLATVEDKGVTFLFARAWRQWYGGLGIVVFSLALVVRPGMTAKGLSALEDTEDGDLVGSVRAHMRDLLSIYLVMTAVSLAAVWMFAPDFFTALTHTLSAVSTGGFSSFDASLSGVDNPGFAVAVTLSSFAGAIPLVFFWRSYNRRRRHEFLWLQAGGVAVLCVMSSLALLAAMGFSGMDWSRAAFHGPMMALSAQTTAGFSTMSPAELPESGRLLLVLSMFVGGSIGSTAGGFKVLRLIMALKLLQSLAWRSCLTRHAVYKPSIGSATLSPHVFEDALNLIFIYLLVTALSWLAFLAYGLDPMNSLFEVVSALGTVGLSAGLCGPELPSFLKGVLGANMLLGRLEVMAWIILLSPWNWTRVKG